jgi:hypothetical protein
MKQDPKVARALRAARKCYADGGDVTTADVRRKLADQVTNRGTILPFADYADGSTRLAWPGILYEPAAAWKRMVDEGPTAEDSFTVASAVPIAGLAAAAVRPGASLGSGGGKLTKSIPMDEASRMARAREMGFDTERTYYHGTPKAGFENFKDIAYFTGNPELANIYADKRASALNPKIDENAPRGVYPVHLTDRNRLVVSDRRVGPDGSPRGSGWYPDNLQVALGLTNEDLKAAGGGSRVRRLYEIARDRGHDIVEIRDMMDLGGTQTQYVALDPRNIRSVNAAFDPDQIDSANLLAANSSKASTPGLAALESNRVRGGLPMDEASRMARARELGFEIDAYHGTKAGSFDSFSQDKLGAATGAPSSRQAYFFASKPEVAETYAYSPKSPRAQADYEAKQAKYEAAEQSSADVQKRLGELFEQRDTLPEAEYVARWNAILADDVPRAEINRRMYDAIEQRSKWEGTKDTFDDGSVMPVKLRMKNPLVKDYGGAEYRDETFNDLLRRAQAEGHDGAVFKNVYDAWKMYGGDAYTGDIYAVFDPKNIRSKFAAFDPSKSDSANLLASNPSTASVLSLINQRKDRE